MRYVLSRPKTKSPRHSIIIVNINWYVFKYLYKG